MQEYHETISDNNQDSYTMRSALSHNRNNFYPQPSNSVFIKPEITRSNNTILGTMFKNSSSLRLGNHVSKLRKVHYEDALKK
jgi:hypothetical protein